MTGPKRLAYIRTLIDQGDYIISTHTHQRMSERRVRSEWVLAVALHGAYRRTQSDRAIVVEGAVRRWPHGGDTLRVVLTTAMWNDRMGCIITVLWPNDPKDQS